jgi:hypothetical protein
MKRFSNPGDIQLQLPQPFQTNALVPVPAVESPRSPLAPFFSRDSPVTLNAVQCGMRESKSRSVIVANQIHPPNAVDYFLRVA